MQEWLELIFVESGCYCKDGDNRNDNSNNNNICCEPGTDWVDPLDPTVIAENELLSAANSIEAAAKKLAQLQPRLRPRVRVLVVFYSLSFIDVIFVFCKKKLAYIWFFRVPYSGWTVHRIKVV